MRLLGFVALCAALVSVSSVQAQTEADPLLKKWTVDVIVPHLAKFKGYPRASKARGEEGKVWVSFTVDRNGRLLGSVIFRPSRLKDLNKAATEIVRRAAPYPPFPREAKQDHITLIAPIQFSLRDEITN